MDHVRRTVFIILALLVLSAAIYAPVRHFGYVKLDDPRYVSEFPRIQNGLSWANVRWAFTTNYFSNWHPLTWLSYMLDAQMFGVRPGAFHVVNVILHAINAALLFLLLDSLTHRKWPSALVAAIFAAHPMHVESVAWIAERKDVLSTAFLFAAILAYVRYARTPNHRARALWYALTLVSFMLSLSAKAMGVTLPALLLLLDYWPLGRLRMGGAIVAPDSAKLMGPVETPQWLVLEKAPLIIASILVSAVAAAAQRAGGSVISIVSLSVWQRVGNAIIAYFLYIAKLVIPTNLAVFYPHPGTRPLDQIAAAAILLVLLTLLIVRARRNRPYLIVGWLWFLISLLPVLGLMQIGEQAMADRYTYVPSVGLFIMLVWGVLDLGGLFQRRKSSVIVQKASNPWLGRTMIVLGTGWVLVLGLLARRQVGYWRDDETLFRHALAVTGEDNWLAQFRVAADLAERHETVEAIRHLGLSIQSNPDYAKAYNNLGCILYQGNSQAAVPLFEKAVELEPRNTSFRANLGLALAKSGDDTKAVEMLRHALAQDPASPEVNTDFANVLRGRKDFNRARQYYEAALRADPNYAPAREGLKQLIAAEAAAS
jgi:hypothetical protein